MLHKLLVLIFMGLLPLATLAEQHIYRWVDDQGLVHYGDSVPDKYKDKATRKPELKDDHPVVDVDGTAKEQRARAQAREVIEGAPPGNPPVPASAAAPDSKPAAPSAGTLTCQQQWEQYNASQACFAPYRLANGGLRAEALEHCVAVPEPPRCE